MRGALLVDNALINLIHDIPTGAACWEDAFDLLRQSFDGDGAVVMTHAAGSAGALSRQCLCGYDDSVWKAYADTYAALDPIAAVVRDRCPHGQMVKADHELVDPRVMRKTEFCNDFRRPNGIAHMVSADVARDIVHLD